MKLSRWVATLKGMVLTKTGETVSVKFISGPASTLVAPWWQVDTPLVAGTQLVTMPWSEKGIEIN